ncbi:MAG: tetratricopeptide repeat protein [Bacteroidota bacterium]
MSVLFVTATLNSAFAQTPAGSNAGLKMIEREQPKKGIEELKKDPNNFFNLGTGLFITGNVSEAAAAFDKGIAADPKNALCIVGKGRIALKQNNLPAAEAEFQKALDMTKSKNAEVLAAVGEAWLDKPELAAKAKPILEKSISSSKNFKAYMLLGDFYAKQGNGGNAITNYENAAGIDAKDGAPHYKVGVVYIRSGNIEAAKEALTKAVTTDPTYTQAYKELAKQYYNAKDCDNAVKNQTKYMELTENPDSGLMSMGFYQFMCKDFKMAIELFNQADGKGVLKATGIRFLASSYDQSQDYPNTAKVFERYFALDTADDEAASDWARYGNALWEIGKTKADKKEQRVQDSLAIIAYKRSLSLEPKQTKLQEQVGDMLLKYKRPEAVDAFKALLGLYGKPVAGAVFKLGQSFYYTAQFDSAAARFKQLSVMQPALTVGYLWTGRAHAQLDPESTQGLAKPDFEKVIEVGSVTPDKSKADLIQAYSYLGYYFYLQKDLNESLKNWKKVLELDAKNEQANTAVKSIDQMKKAAQPKPQGGK